MQDRPSAAELLGAIAAFLATEVGAVTRGALNQRVEVAARLLAILQREQEQRAPVLLRERQRLCELLGIGTDELLPGTLSDQVADLQMQLASELEAQALDPAFEQSVWEVLMHCVTDKLAITRPGYADHDGE